MSKSIALFLFLCALGLAQYIDEICLQPADSGRCEANGRRWTFNTDSRRCVKFIYGGCGGNDNNFKSKEDCEKKCPCSKCSGFMECERCYMEIEARLRQQYPTDE